MKNYFELNEFIYSDTAIKNKIDNTPSFEVVQHLQQLRDELLNDLREKWGSAIKVTSGYRCAKLNLLVGGVSNSGHLYGYAADIVPVNGKFNIFCQFIKAWANDKMFDQIIIEQVKGKKWIHISLYNDKKQQRRQVFNL